MWLLSALACTSAHVPARPAAGPAELTFVGGTVVGVGAAELSVREGHIAEVGPSVEPLGEVVSIEGRWLVPAFIDSHVHVVYRPEAAALARGGIAAAVDLAAPTSVFSLQTGPLRLVASGPMVTAPSGYPTQSWGRDGYGLECADADAAVQAVTELHGLGAGVIKLPVTGGHQLGPEALAAAVARAHELDLRVASHAMSDSAARSAATAGVDVLAHTPTSALSSEALSAWGDRAVITTLVAFGDGAQTRANLAALKERGAVVLYGTDQGNTGPRGVWAPELAAMAGAGLTPAEILAAGTTAPASWWGLDDLGVLAPGYAASLLVLDADPLVDPLALARPVDVYLDGVRVGP